MGSALDEKRADRSTNHATGDNANHRGRNRQRRRAGDACLFEERREGEAGRRSTGQRDRAGEDAHQGVLPKRPGNRAADHVLEHRHDRGNHEEADNERSAASEQRYACGESDRREERVLQRHL
jgi:hypothetical protein